MVVIKYNNSVIASLAENKMARLPCKRKIMRDDIVISADDYVLVKYRGNTIADLFVGESATIKCKGKTMIDDILIEYNMQARMMMLKRNSMQKIGE